MKHTTRTKTIKKLPASHIGNGLMFGLALFALGNSYLKTQAPKQVIVAQSVSTVPPFTCDSCHFGGALGEKFKGKDLTDAYLAYMTVNGNDQNDGTLTPDFSSTIFHNAIMVHANFTGVIIHAANFSNANLNNAQITNNDFTNANFTDTTLISASPFGNDFTSANFTNANLQSSADWSNNTFTDATWSNTTCPDGTNSDDDGNTCEGHLNAPQQ